MKYYFDHAATTPIYPEALKILHDNYQLNWCNPNSNNRKSKLIKSQIEECRKYFLNYFKANSDDHFLFTSSATESNNTIIQKINLADDSIVLYTSSDHPSVVQPLLYKAKNKKIKLIEYRILKNGLIDEVYFEQLIKNYSDKIKLVIFTEINNQSGVIQNIEKLAILIKEHTNAFIHIDAVQSFTKIKAFNIEYIDSVTISAHKIGGPCGIAGLLIKKKSFSTLLGPLLFGGGQENNLRSGTEAFPLIFSFRKATELAIFNLKEDFHNLNSLISNLKENLKIIIPKATFPFVNHSPYILCFLIPNISSDIILRHLEEFQIIISSTSACSSKIKNKSEVLTALNIPDHLQKNVLRISFSKNTSFESLEYLLKKFQQVWKDLNYLIK